MFVNLLHYCSSVSLDLELEDWVPLKPGIVDFSDSTNNLPTPQLQAIELGRVFNLWNSRFYEIFCNYHRVHEIYFELHLFPAGEPLISCSICSQKHSHSLLCFTAVGVTGAHFIRIAHFIHITSGSQTELARCAQQSQYCTLFWLSHCMLCIMLSFYPFSHKTWAFVQPATFSCSTLLCAAYTAHVAAAQIEHCPVFFSSELQSHRLSSRTNSYVTFSLGKGFITISHFHSWWSDMNIVVHHCTAIQLIYLCSVYTKVNVTFLFSFFWKTFIFFLETLQNRLPRQPSLYSF